jgi:hypothetical protein
MGKGAGEGVSTDTFARAFSRAPHKDNSFGKFYILTATYNPAAAVLNGASFA